MELTHVSSRRLVISLLAVPLIALAIAACGGSDDEGQSSGNGEQNMVGGMVACNASSIEDGVKAWAKAYGGGEKAILPEDPGAFRCADGWAVAFPLVGEGEGQIEVTVVLEAEGQFWIPKDRAKVCGDSSADSEVPGTLYRDACQTN